MSNKMDIFERRMVNINGDLQERVIHQRHMAEDTFIDASGIVERWIEIWASGIINESYVLTSPATQVANPHYTYSFDVNLTPDVSGVRDLGTVSNAFNEAYIDSVFLEEDPTYPLEAATKQYVDASVHMNEFIELVDTPSSYSGMAASGVRVTAGEDGLEFCDLASANTLQSVTDNGNVTTNYIEIGGSLTSGDVTPTPSGALDCGWQDQTWHAGYFDNLYAYILYGNVLNLGTTNITSASGLMVLTDASGSFTLGDLYGGGAGGVASFFSTFGGDGSEGAITVSSDTDVSAIDSVNPGIIEATTFTVNVGETLTVDTTFLYLGVQGVCTIHGTIDADAQGPTPTGCCGGFYYPHGVGPAMGLQATQFVNADLDRHEASGLAVAKPYVYALSGAGGHGNDLGDDSTSGYGAGAGGAGGTWDEAGRGSYSRG